MGIEEERRGGGGGGEGWRRGGVMEVWGGVGEEEFGKRTGGLGGVGEEEIWGEEGSLNFIRNYIIK